ncbi:PIR protein [Plasmodium malariae]|uniref:PIR protein n=1 Tax=Plasmodium malariae TaxID=5858 RepID=A0A1D3JI70_PLAMA|nr:PIR protein [Plasmodium malariae]SBT86060.1 PIR protein [Plasmodium malariae]
MSSVLQENFIQSLPSKIYYRQNFETKVNYCLSYEDEEKFLKKRNEIYNNGKIKSIADKLMSPLCYVAFTNEGDECNKQYHNLYYWLGNELFNKLEEDSFSKVIGILEDVSNVFSGGGRCKCKFFKNINKEKFEKMKIVFDYCKDHEKIEKTLELYKKTCDSKFNDYLVKANSAYNEIYNCTENNSEPYCYELKNHVTNCLNKKLSSLKCEIKEVSTEDKASSQYNTDYIDPEYVRYASIFSSSQIFLYFVLPFIGILLIGFLLYKFTPVWSWIQARVLKKKSIRRNFNDMDKLELTEYTYEKRKSNVSRRQLNVGYYAT